MEKYKGHEIVDIIESSFNIDVKEISYWDRDLKRHVKVTTIGDDSDDDNSSEE